jgi:capsular polysaccharide biosynthesis protein
MLKIIQKRGKIMMTIILVLILMIFIWSGFHIKNHIVQQTQIKKMQTEQTTNNNDYNYYKNNKNDNYNNCPVACKKNCSVEPETCFKFQKWQKKQKK